MPFLDDTAPRDEHRRPFWAALATVGGQVERLVATNIAWALVLTPAALALVAPGLPGWLRIVLGLLTATALPPATAVLYGLAAQACEGQHVDAGLAVELAHRLTVPSLRTLGPLYGTFGVLAWLAIIAAGQGLAPLVSVLTLLLMLWALCAMYWGPAFVPAPDEPFTALARGSVRLSWRQPERTLATLVVVALLALIGVVSVAGLVLIVPVLIAVLQTHQYRDALAAPPARRPRRARYRSRV